MSDIDTKIAKAEIELAEAEVALSDANETGDPNRIQRAETRLSNATDAIERLREEL